MNLQNTFPKPFIIVLQRLLRRHCFQNKITDLPLGIFMLLQIKRKLQNAEQINLANAEV
jgi:hypothetical protein